MATVPKYERQVQSAGTPNVRQGYISTSVPDYGTAIGRGLQHIGMAMEKQAQIDDSLRAEEAFNKLRERQLQLTLGQEGFTNVKGKGVLQRESGMSLTDEYVQSFDSYLDELESTLANDRQKQALRQRAAVARLDFISGLMRHENAQINAWRKEVFDGGLAVEAENARRNWNNPEALQLSLERIDVLAGNIVQQEGIAADKAFSIVRAAKSKVHMGVLDEAIGARNLAYAQDYLKRYGHEMEAADVLKVRGLLTKEIELEHGYGAAHEVMKQVRADLRPTEMMRLTNIVMDMESGGQRYGADGKLLESPKGAKGEMQVMDGTNRDPGFGVEPAKDDSPEERARVGRDYLAAMVTKYKGNIGHALAAYNAGPGAVDKALKEAAEDAKEFDTLAPKLEAAVKAYNDGVAAHNAQPTKESQAALEKAKAEIDAMQAKVEALAKGRDWLSKLPKETQDYVAKGVKLYAEGGGAPQRPTLESVLAAVDARLGPSASPATRKYAHEEATRLYEVEMKAIKQREDEAISEAYKLLDSNGGDFRALPPNLRAMLPGDKLPALQEYARKLSSGEKVETNLALYQLLSDPRNLANLSAAQLYALKDQLSPADFKHFANEHAKLSGGQLPNKADDLNTEAMNRALNDRLRMFGIDPTPKDGSSAAQRVGAIRQFVTRSILAEQAQRGAKMSDAEIEKHIDNLFAHSTEFRERWWGNTGGKPLLTMSIKDVPDEARTKIRDAFRADGVEPTDAQILDAYWRARFSKKSVLKPAKQSDSAPVSQIPK